MFIVPGKKNMQNAAVAMSIMSTRQGCKFLHKMGGNQGTVFACTWSRATEVNGAKTNIFLHMEAQQSRRKMMFCNIKALSACPLYDL